MPVIGFDDPDLETVAEVPLTSVVHPKYWIRKWAAEILFENIDAGGTNPPKQMRITPKIAIRDSVKVVST